MRFGFSFCLRGLRVQKFGFVKPAETARLETAPKLGTENPTKGVILPKLRKLPRPDKSGGVSAQGEVDRFPVD